MKVTPKERQKETLRLKSLSARGVKAFGEFPKDINKSGSPIEKPKQ